MSFKQGHDITNVDPRVIRTRQLILQAFVELLMEKSFQDITVQDITRRATVNRVTFYAHFADKYALLEYTFRQMIQERLQGQAPEGILYSQENVAWLIQTICEFLEEIEQRCPAPHGQLETLMEKQIKAELNQVLQGWLVESSGGKARSRSEIEQAAMVASWAIYGAAMQWLQQQRREPARDYAQQVLPLIMGSLQPVFLV